MWFFSSPSLLVLHRSGVDLYRSGEKGATLVFTQDVFSMLEVRDPKKLASLFTTWVKDHKLQSKKMIILLSPEVVFRKKTLRDSKQHDQELLKEFEGQIPLSSSEKQLKLLQTPSENYFFSTNASLLRLIRDTLESVHASVLCAVPIELFGIGTQESILTEEQVRKILRGTRLQTLGNFFGETIATVKPMKKFFFF